MKTLVLISALLIAASASAQTVYDMLVDFEGSTNGTQLSTTNLATATHGGNGSWCSGGATSQIVYGTLGQLSNLLSPVTVSSTVYPGTGTLGMLYTSSNAANGSFIYCFNSVGNSVSIGQWFMSNMPTSETAAYTQTEISCTPFGGNSCSGAQHYVDFYILGGNFHLETPGAQGGSACCIAYAPNTLYWVTTQYNTYAGVAVYDHMEVYDQFGNLQPCASVAPQCSGGLLTPANPVNSTQQADYILIGSDGDQPQLNGDLFLTDNLGVNYTNGTFPLGILTPAHSGASPTWTTTPDSASVSSVISSASSGDTINVKPGISSWASREVFSNKNLIIQGAGPVNPQGTVNTSGTAVTWHDGNQFATTWTGTMSIAGTAYKISSCASATACTLTTSAGTQTASLYTTNQSGTLIGNSSLQADNCNNPCRFSGFTWNLGTTDNYMQISGSTGWEVDNNNFILPLTSSNFLMLTFGDGATPTEGLFTHNYDAYGQLVNFGESSGTGGAYTWALPLRYGTSHAVYAEANTVNFQDGSGNGAFLAFTECNFGGRLVDRFNTIIGSDLRTHGMQANGSDGCMVFEQYNNNILSTSSTISAASCTGSVVTATLATPSNFVNTASNLYVSGANPAGYNVSGVAGTISGSTLTYPVSSCPGSYVGSGLAYLPPAEPLRARGGSGFIFHNNTDGNALPGFNQIDIDTDRANEDSLFGQLGSTLWWEYCDGLTTSSYLTTPGNLGGGYSTYSQAKTTVIDGGGTGGYPCRDQLGRGPNATQWNYSGSPPTQSLAPAFIWRNTYPGGELPIVLTCETAGDNLCTNQSSNIVIQNRDWYGYNASFTGATGVGEGTLASRPSTCTTGVGYWATDQGSWNTLGTSGLFYQCTSTNTWTQNYTPYVYPFSFSSVTVVASPSNLIIAEQVPRIELEWDASPTEGVDYDIWRSVDGGDFAVVKRGLLQLSWTDTDVVRGTTYAYKSKAYLPPPCSKNCDSMFSDGVSTVCCQ